MRAFNPQCLFVLLLCLVGISSASAAGWSDYEVCVSDFKKEHPRVPASDVCLDKLQEAFNSKDANAIALVAMLSIEDKIYGYVKKYKVTLPIHDAIEYAIQSAKQGVRTTGSSGMLAAYYSYVVNANYLVRQRFPSEYAEALYEGAKWSFITVSLTPSKYQASTLPKTSEYFLEKLPARYSLNAKEIGAMRSGVEAGQLWIRNFLPQAIVKNKDGVDVYVDGDFDKYVN